MNKNIKEMLTEIVKCEIRLQEVKLLEFSIYRYYVVPAEIPIIDAKNLVLRKLSFYNLENIWNYETYEIKRIYLGYARKIYDFMNKYDDNYKICYPHEFEYKICNSNDIGAIPVWLAELKESWEE